MILRRDHAQQMPALRHKISETKLRDSNLGCVSRTAVDLVPVYPHMLGNILPCSIKSAAACSRLLVQSLPSFFVFGIQTLQPNARDCSRVASHASYNLTEYFAPIYTSST